MNHAASDAKSQRRLVSLDRERRAVERAKRGCPDWAPLGVAFRFGAQTLHQKFTRKNFRQKIATNNPRQDMREFHVLFRCKQGSPAKLLWISRVNSKAKENVERSRAFILRSNSRNPNLTLRCRSFLGGVIRSPEHTVNSWQQLRPFRTFKERT